jgi:hypothetical protein
MSDSDNNEFVQRRDHYNGYGIDNASVRAPGCPTQRSGCLPLPLAFGGQPSGFDGGHKSRVVGLGLVGVPAGEPA